VEIENDADCFVLRGFTSTLEIDIVTGVLAATAWDKETVIKSGF
jgi:hypothetical protein